MKLRMIKASVSAFSWELRLQQAAMAEEGEGREAGDGEHDARPAAVAGR